MTNRFLVHTVGRNESCNCRFCNILWGNTGVPGSENTNKQHKTYGDPLEGVRDSDLVAFDQPYHRVSFVTNLPDIEIVRSEDHFTIL